MKFEIKTEEIEKLDNLLKIFTIESIKEYNRQIEKIPAPEGWKNSLPLFDTDYYYDKEKNCFILWNTFEVPKTIKKFGFLNPFKKAVNEMQRNLEKFIKDNGVNAKVKLIE